MPSPMILTLFPRDHQTHEAQSLMRFALYHFRYQLLESDCFICASDETCINLNENFQNYTLGFNEFASDRLAIKPQETLRPTSLL